MSKRLFAGVAGLLVGCLCLMAPGVASAHVLKVDGHIGAVLHINPDDNPTTGSPTNYVMSFSDDSGRFSLPECDCKVTIIENGRTVATESLANSSHETSENSYTFARPGVYDMRFIGAPKQAGEFQPFTLNYEVRVMGNQSATQPFPLLLWVGMGMGIGLILLAAYALDYDGGKEIKAMNKEHQ